MDSRADTRNVPPILLSEDASSSMGRADIATWAMVPVQEKKEGSEWLETLSVLANTHLELRGSSADLVQTLL